MPDREQRFDRGDAATGGARIVKTILGGEYADRPKVLWLGVRANASWGDATTPGELRAARGRLNFTGSEQAQMMRSASERDRSRHNPGGEG